jgi:hypothetical protein
VEPPGLPVPALAADDAGPILFEGLVPGRYVVQAEIGEWFRGPLILGAAPVEVSAGARAAVRLELKDRPVPGSKVPLEGMLVFPGEWEDRRIAIDFEPMDRPQAKTGEGIRVELESMEPVAGRSGHYRWSAGVVVPGKYLATIREFELQVIVDVGPAGRKDAEIRIGAPTEIEVRVVDAETGAPADVERLWWNCRRPEESTGGSSHWAPRADGLGVFSFQAPAAEIELSAHAVGYEWNEEHVTARPIEKNVFTLKLKRSCGLIVTVREAEGALPYDLIDDAIDVRDNSGSDAVRGSSSDRNEHRLTLDGPGTYKVTIGKLPGYQPVEPVTVEVPPGKFVNHEVMLRREP